MRWHRCLYPRISDIASFLPPSPAQTNKGGRIRTDFDSAEGNHGAVDLVHDTIDLLQIVGVGDDLVTSDNILFTMRSQ